MKQLLSRLLCALALAVISCNDPESEVPTIAVSFSDKWEADLDAVTITCTVTGNMSVDRLYLEYSKDASLDSPQAVMRQNQGERFTITISGLEPQTTYYYRYIIENNVSRYQDTQIRQFQTRDYSVPGITTLDAESVSGTRATLKSRLDYTGGKPITQQGFMLGTDKEKLEKKPSNSADGTLTVEGLSFNTTYYYQAYATSEIGTGMGEIKQFTTSGSVSFKEVKVSNITSTSAVVSGGIASDGGITVEKQGFKYSVSGTTDFTFVQSEGASTLTNLKPATKYLVWYYAKTFEGEFESNKVEFVTNAVAVSSITLNKTSLTLEKGSSETLTATVTPSDAADKTVTWSSSNTSVVTVSNGTVTAIAGGSATITAKAGDKTATCTVTVTVPVNGISVSPQSVSLKVGQTATLTATVSPSDATDKSVTWTSSNTSVATVSAYGTVTAVAEGTATITAKAGNYSATCSMEVHNVYAYADNLGTYSLTAYGKYRYYSGTKYVTTTGGVSYYVKMIENEVEQSYKVILMDDSGTETDYYFIVDWDSDTGSMSINSKLVREWNYSSYGKAEDKQYGYVEYQSNLYTADEVDYMICLADAPKSNAIVFNSAGKWIYKSYVFDIIGLSLITELVEYDDGSYYSINYEIPFPMTLTKTRNSTAVSASTKKAPQKNSFSQEELLHRPLVLIR